MSENDDYLADHRRRWSEREVRIRATFPAGVLNREPEPDAPPKPESRLEGLRSHKPIELTEEQQRARRRAMAMIEIEAGLAKEAAGAEQARAAAIDAVKQSTAIGRLLR